MHFHLPKPLHGWRAFVGEVGIIVVGVLIALAAEQVVENMHWRDEVAEFRSAANSELAHNLAGYRYRLRQGACVARRIAELQRWGEAGGTKPLALDIGRPAVIITKTSVWNTKGDALAHMPLALRLDYSDLYDQLANVQGQIDDEREAWRNLAAFDHARSLDPNQQMRLDELLYRAKSIDRVLRLDWGPVAADAARLGVRPDFGRDARFIPPPDPAFCEPVTAG
jgi:hypothetical protein